MEFIQLSSKIGLQAMSEHVYHYGGIIESQLRALCLVILVSKFLDIK